MALLEPVPHVVPVSYGPCPPFERQAIEEDEDYVVRADNWGIVRRDTRHNESMCEFVKFPVADRADWERYRGERLDPHHPDRVWPAVGTGRYIADLDHCVPDDVSWESYRYYAEQLRRRVVGA